MKKIIIPIVIGLIVTAGSVVFMATRREKPCSNCMKSEITKTKTASEPTGRTVPLPQEEDIVRNFFALIEEKRPSDAVSMMSKTITENDTQKQAWAVQFNAINSMQILKIEPSLPETWTGTEHIYKLILEVKMNPDSANASIPYYGWDNGQNYRWVTIIKENNLWKIKGLATGP